MKSNKVNKQSVKDNLKMTNVTSKFSQNGAYGGQNGDAHTPLIFSDALETSYRTFRPNHEDERVRLLDEYNIKWYDLLLAILVMLMGMSATIIATYSSWSNTISSAEFSPPCLVNVTSAARSFFQDSVKTV